ncbi:hypothetical protein H4582DRAFT_2062478 [Lactarius indigo]|nr:hypothetical protein H4582DRAFT_2062478 [Lactarius indigo]
MFNDSHDTTIDFAADYWLVPLLNDTNQDTNFNDNRTLTLLTFDETETHCQQPHPRHTTWGLGSLDCSNMNKHNPGSAQRALMLLRPVNLTAQGKTVPWLGPRVAAASFKISSSGNGNGAAGSREGMVGATVLGAVLAGVMTLLLA